MQCLIVAQGPSVTFEKNKCGSLECRIFLKCQICEMNVTFRESTDSSLFTFVQKRVTALLLLLLLLLFSLLLIFIPRYGSMLHTCHLTGKQINHGYYESILSSLRLERAHDNVDSNLCPSFLLKIVVQCEILMRLYIVTFLF